MTVATAIRRWALAILGVLSLLGATGCASLSGNPNAVAYDPFEPMNRAVFAVNDVVDAAVLRPVARVYVDYVPEGLRGVVGNIFGNVADVWTAFNQLLQGKPIEALGDISRFVINSTFGFFGVADIATELGLEKHREDLGQTLGRWGLPAGPYLVLPFFGPSSVRDTAGFAVDLTVDPVTKTDPVALRNTASVSRAVDARARLFPAEKLLEGASLDKYSFVRDGYLQRRRSQVYDGNPPPTQE